MHVPQSQELVAEDSLTGQLHTSVAIASGDAHVRMGMLESAMRRHTASTPGIASGTARVSGAAGAAAFAAAAGGSGGGSGGCGGCGGGTSASAAAAATVAGTAGCALQILRMRGCGVTNKGADFLLGKYQKGAFSGASSVL